MGRQQKAGFRGFSDLQIPRWEATGPGKPWHASPSSHPKTTADIANMQKCLRPRGNSTREKEQEPEGGNCSSMDLRLLYATGASPLTLHARLIVSPSNFTLTPYPHPILYLEIKNYQE